MAPKPSLDIVTTILSLSQLTCFTLHPFLTHLLLTRYRFTYPATLSLIQVTITAICLWFWSLFGLYRIRTIPFINILPLAASAAALALLALFTLATSSLLIFQTARLVSAVLVLSIRYRQPVTAFVALFAASLLMYHSEYPILIPVCYTLFASVNALVIHPFAASIKASELQLQVLLRTLAAVMLLPTVLLLDHFNSSNTITNFAFNDTSILLVFASGLIAFMSFASSRASLTRLTPEFHTCLLLCSNLAVYLCHFITTAEHLRLTHVLGVGALAASWLFLAEKRKLGVENDQPV